MKQPLPPSLSPEFTDLSQTVRVTVPVRPDVLQAFQRLAKASSVSTGRAMGEWLADTVEAVEFRAVKVEEARSAPRRVAMELHAYAQGAADVTGEFLRDVRERARADAATGRRARSPERREAAPAPPRPVIRGGKSHPTGGKAGRAGGSSK